MTKYFFCPRWGFEELSWNSFCAKVKACGYDGIEAGVPFDEAEKKEMKEALQRHGLFLIGQYWQSFEKDFESHKKSYRLHLNNFIALNPLKINAQTGKDYFSFEQNKELFETASEFAKINGVPIVHETHRNKALFAAHVTYYFLQRIPTIQITADFSHWCNVAESYLEDQMEAVSEAIKHTYHIHARVGHTQSAQVTDPRLPEWKEALDHHLNWWKCIINEQLSKKMEVCTITPEFGPTPYMISDPITKKLLANQWEINLWMMEILRKEL